MSGIHRHLLTVSSDDIMEIHIIYDAFGSLFDREDLWGEIDNLIVREFPSSSTLSIERKFGDSFHLSVFRTYPQVYQKGILHAVLPRCLL